MLNVEGGGRYYLVMDRPTLAELKVLGFDKNFRPSCVTIAMVKPFVPGKMGIVGVRTNEHRRPLKGEWFLSGAIPEAYRAGCDYEQEHYIVRLVVIETKLRFIEVSFHRTKQLTESS